MDVNLSLTALKQTELQLSVALRLRRVTAASSALRQFPPDALRQRSAARRLDSRDHARTTRPRENQETTR